MASNQTEEHGVLLLFRTDLSIAYMPVSGSLNRADVRVNLRACYKTFGALGLVARHRSLNHIVDP